MADLHHLEVLNQGSNEWNIWRANNPKIIPDLRNANLEGMVLSETNLPNSDRKTIRINLKNVDLSGANLTRCVLDGALLSGANLKGANLRKADLRKADLRETSLIGARLNRANLTLARLYKTDFTGSHIWETIFSRVDLSTAVGLNECIQGGPTIIDERTFRESKNIPEKFLKGCGYSDWQISASKLNSRHINSSEVTEICYEIIDLRANPTIQFYSCFISYSHKDKKFATKLHDALQEYGIRCWLDDHQLLPGDDIYEHVDRGIQLWDKVLLVCSENSLNSWWVDNEILTAFEKEQSLMKDRNEKVGVVIPINIDGYVFSETWTRGFKKQLQSRLVASFENWKTDANSYSKQLGKLVAALRADSEARETPPVSLL